MNTPFCRFTSLTASPYWLTSIPGFIRNPTTPRFPWVILVTLILTGFIDTLGARDVRSIGTQTNGFDGAWGPKFSRDGRHLFFHATLSGAGAVRTVLYRLQLQNDELLPILEFGPGIEDEVSLLDASRTGSRILFTSRSPRLSNLKTNADIHDIFWKDLRTGEVRLVSVSHDLASSGNHHSFHATLSDDGRFVAFESRASNLSTNDLDSGPFLDSPDVFWRDMETGDHRLVSFNTNPASASQHVAGSSISGDGRRVCFFSAAASWVTNPVPAGVNLYVWDADSNRISWVDPLGAVGTPTTLRTYHSATWSADGNFLVASIGPRQGKRVIRYQIQSNQSELLFSSIRGYDQNIAIEPAFRISADAKRVILENSPTLEMWVDGKGSGIWQRYGNLNEIGPTTTGRVEMSGDGNSCVALSHYQFGLGEAAFVAPQLVWISLTDSNLSSRITHPPNSETNYTRQDFIGEFAISHDGRWVAFESSDSPMDPQDTNGVSDMFLYDHFSRRTRCISSILWNPESHGTGRATFSVVDMTPNGNAILYAEMVGRWSQNISNFMADAVLVKPATGEEKRIPLKFGKIFSWPIPIALKIAAQGRYGLTANMGSGSNPLQGTEMQMAYYDFQESRETFLAPNQYTAPWEDKTAKQLHLSADGKIMVWTQAQSPTAGSPWTGSPWVTTSPLATNQIAMRRLGINTNEAISVDVTRRNLGDRSSFSPWVFPDGARVAFLSDASQLTSVPVSAGPTRLYVRDLESRSTRIIGMPEALGGVDTGLHSYRVATTALRFALNGTNTQAALFDLTTTDPNWVSIPGLKRVHAISDNGAWAVVTDHTTPARAVTVLNLLDLSRQHFHPNTWKSDSTLPDDDYRFTITPDGRYTIHVDPMTTGANRHVWIYDRLSDTSFPLSSDSVPATAKTRTLDPLLSQDGSKLIVRSWDTGLTQGDANRRSDWVMVDLGSEDTDQDGISDAWEMTYFNSLERDGFGDQDQDGASDLNEFKAGTNPAQGLSYLQLISIRTFVHEDSLRNVELQWTSTPGRWYSVEYRDDITGGSWQRLGDAVQAHANTTSLIDDQAILSPQTKRFYRVSWVP